jgi:T-complex protein 1 subunit beta
VNPTLKTDFFWIKKIGVGQPRRIEKAKILVSNTSMDTDKIKIYGTKVKVDSLLKVSEIEEAEKARCHSETLLWLIFSLFSQ